jgi:hypothetical protein
VPELIKVARVAASETGGVGTDADARKRLMIVPRVRVLDVITETQSDNWVRVTGVRVKDIDGLEKVISLAAPPNGNQSAVVVALGTIESTRLALNTFKDSLSSRAAQRMGRNLIAHLRSNLTIRIPVTSLTSLPSSAMTSLQASARICRKLQNRAGLFYLKAAIHTQFRAADKSPKSVMRPICDRSIPFLVMAVESFITTSFSPTSGPTTRKSTWEIGGTYAVRACSFFRSCSARDQSSSGDPMGQPLSSQCR